MQYMGLNEIRERFLSFFEEKAHTRLASFPLVPQGDNSLLLINSGMAPLKPYFTGEQVPPNVRVTTCQKCIRTPDIERVGKTSRHGTYFEMLGNFSFGDYFKHEATKWAWEFITEVMDIPVDRLWVSVFEGDENSPADNETKDIWINEVGVPADRIVKLGKADNFWEIGAGPCGPCSEIYFDRGAEHACDNPNCAVGCDCDRYVEFWNLVFSQFNNDGNGNYTPLAKKNIDTGMGLERLACIMQGVNSLFDVDTVRNITKHISEIANAHYGDSEEVDVSLRVITDHIRSTTMMVCDGVIPSNEGRGYVLRRLLRRAARHGKLLGITRPFLFEVCDTVIRESGNAYLELIERQDRIRKIIKMEEERFDATIDAGLKILEDMIANAKKNGLSELPSEDTFKLYDTFGFPVELTEEILAENDLTTSREGFDALMLEQKQRARAATKKLGDFGWEAEDLGLDKAITTKFVGYDNNEAQCKVLAIVADGEVSDSASVDCNVKIVLDQTPFYAESGGQVADHGTIKTTDGGVIVISDVQKTKDGKFIHSGKVESGVISVGDEITASIDIARRKAIMRAHTATHLLQKALRTVLGSHVEQAGSYTDADNIRFDFSHFAGMTPEEITQVEDMVNQAILDGYDVEISEMSIDEAKKLGAMALFGEKYGNTVRVVRAGDFSTELCGGTHLDNTAKVGLFKIVSESSVAAGVRRIEAITGNGVLALINKNQNTISETAKALKTIPTELVQKVEQTMNEMKEMSRTIDKLSTKIANAELVNLLNISKDIKGIDVIAAQLDDVSMDTMRNMGDALKDKQSNSVTVLSTVNDGKINFLCVCGKEAIAKGAHAGKIIKEVAKITQGGGGGRPDSATAGGKNIEKLEEALEAVNNIVESIL